MTRPNVTLVHGWGMRPAVWDALRAALEPTHHVLTPALPGHGEDSASRTDEDWVAALAAQMPPSSAVIGWSLGGQLAMRLAIKHPQRVERLILIGTSPRFVQAPDWPHALDAKTVEGFTRNFAADPAQTIRRFLALQVMGDADRRGTTRRLNQALCALEPGRIPTLARGLELLAQTDVRQDIAKITCPVRLFHGEHDALMPVAAAHWLADHIPGAQLTCFTDAGHAPFLSRAADLTVLTRRFLDG